MAWKDSLLDASFRDLVFNVKNTKDSAKRSIVEHSYPYRDGAELEDNGLNARRIQMTVVFWGDDYESALQKFIEVLDEGGEGELIHPVFGSLPVMVESYEAPHDAEQRDYVEVAVNFIESGRENPFFNRQLNAAGKSEKKGNEAGAAMKEASASMAQNLAAQLSEFSQKMSMVAQLEFLTDVQEIIGDYQELKSVVLSGLSYLDFPMALVSDLQAIIYEVAWLVDLGPETLTERFSGWQRLSNLFTRLPLTSGSAKTSYPTSTGFYSGYEVGGLTGQPQQSIISLPAEQSTAVEELTIGSDSVSKARASLVAQANLEQTKELVDGAIYILIQEATSPSLSPDEVEAIVGNVRKRIQDSIDEARLLYGSEGSYAVVEKLRTAALAIQDQGAAVINLKPPLTRYQNKRLVNLHLLAHELYGDYSRAGEIMRLNRALRSPSFIAQGMEISIYAK